VGDPDGGKRTNYYGVKSVGIACGMFIAAGHNMGLATVPYTPSPMSFLGEILGRKKNERPYIVFPTENKQIPDLKRKELDEIYDWLI